MTPAEKSIKDRHLSGQQITREDQVQTITSVDELDAFQEALLSRNELTGSLILAIENRRTVLR